MFLIKSIVKIAEEKWSMNFRGHIFIIILDKISEKPMWSYIQ